MGRRKTTGNSSESTFYRSGEFITKKKNKKISSLSEKNTFSHLKLETCSARGRSVRLPKPFRRPPLFVSTPSRLRACGLSSCHRPCRGPRKLRISNLRRWRRRVYCLLVEPRRPCNHCLFLPEKYHFLGTPNLFIT